MKVLLGLFAAISVVQGFKPGIRVKFGMGPGFGETYSYRVSTTIADVVRDGWMQCLRPPGPLPQLTMYCPEDKTVCALFDDTGYIAGIQVALKDTFTNNPFDPIIQKFTKWNTMVYGKRTSMWTLQQYFVSKEYLSRSLKSRLDSRNGKRILQENGVWVTGVHGKLLKISNKEKDIRQSIFTEQGCYTGMGLHFLYNLSRTTECTAEQLYPWFALTYHEELIATVFAVFGKIPLQQGERDWFEHTDTRVAKIIAPRGPDCQFEFVDKYGLLTMHIYYIDDPRITTC